MKVFVAGASGALGAQLVPELVTAGHAVVALTRTASKQDRLRALGADPVVADAPDPDQVAEARGMTEPEVIIHAAVMSTYRLRTEATDRLLGTSEARGASNAKAERDVGLQLRCPSWRFGFTEGLG